MESTDITLEDVKRKLQEYRDRHQLNPLFHKKFFCIAMANKDYEFAKALVSLGIEGVNDKEEEGYLSRPLSSAIWWGKLDMVQFLIHHGVSQTLGVFKSFEGEMNGLMYNSHIARDQVDIARELVLAGSHPDFAVEFRPEHPAKTAADIAYTCRNFKVLAYFKSIGCNVHDFFSVFGFKKQVYKNSFLPMNVSQMPLIQAAYDSDLTEVTRLVEEEGMDLEVTFEDGTSTALVMSALNCNTRVMRNNPFSDPKPKPKPEHEPVRDPNVMKYLLNKQANIQATNINGMTSLHIAVYKHDLDYVREQLLISTEAINTPDNRGVVPILNRCLYDDQVIKWIDIQNEVNQSDGEERNNISMMKLLVENGAQLDQTKNGMYPIEMAFSYGLFGVVEYMKKMHSPEIRFEHFMRYKEVVTEYGESCSRYPLFRAVFRGNVNQIQGRVLKRSKNYMDMRNRGCLNTPLLVTAYMDDIEMFTALMNYNANIELRNQFGMDVFMIAAYYGHSDYLNHLLSMRKYRHMWTNTCNSGKTALMYAVMNNSQGNRAVVTLLLAKGFDRSKTDNEGQTAEQIALENEFHDMVLQLKPKKRQDDTCSQKIPEYSKHIQKCIQRI